MKPLGNLKSLAIVAVLLIATTAAAQVPLYFEAGATFVDPGAVAKDCFGNDISASIRVTSNVNTAKLGTYQVVYTVVDANGIAANPVTRTVQVVDRTAPAITLLGATTVKIRLFSSFKDPGATATDNYDGVITSRITKTSNINIFRSGTYYVRYNVSDTSGNKAAEVVRTVVVEKLFKDEGDDLIITSPVTGSTHYVAGTRLLLTFNATAPEGTESVSYYFDDELAGIADEEPFTVPAEFQVTSANFGEHTVKAVAKTANGEVTTDSIVTLAPAPADADQDGNGIPDNPFVTLAADGDTWCAVSAERKFHILRMNGDGAHAVAQSPAVFTIGPDPLHQWTVMASESAIAEDEAGIVIVGLAASGESLVSGSLAPLTPTAGLTAANAFLAVNILTSTDGGATYTEKAASESDFHVAMDGYSAQDDARLAPYGRPTLAASDDAGIYLAADEGAWSAYPVTLVDGAVAFDMAAPAVMALFMTKAPVVDDKPVDVDSGCAAASIGGVSPKGRGGDITILAVAALMLALFGGVGQARKAAAVTSR